MRDLTTLRAIIAPLAVTLALFVAEPADAAAKLHVVATIPDLKALTEAVGGNLVDVDSLTRGSQNFHDVEVRPSMMLKLRNADVLVENGLDLDAWVDVAARGANNANIVHGARGRIDASQGVHVLAREVVFVDIALAQIAALGATAAFLLGFDLDTWPSYACGLGATIVGALVLAVTRTRERHASQEAVIGVSASATLDLPTGATVVCAFGVTLLILWGLARAFGWGGPVSGRQVLAAP